MSDLLSPRGLRNRPGRRRFEPCITSNQYLTHYCVVRADLPFGVQAAQLIHAAGQSITEPHADGTYAIALAIASEADLRALSLKLALAGVRHVLIIEDDAPYTGQAMAIGITPCDRAKLKRFLSSYALVAQRQSTQSNDLRDVGSTPTERANAIQGLRKAEGGMPPPLS